MSYETISVPNSGSMRDGMISIAVSNIHISASDTFASAEGSPNTSNIRYARITALLNSALATEHHIDLIVLPEVAIPHSYLEYMQRFCRRRQIGIIFGMEHRLIAEEKETPSDLGTAYNHVVTLLPRKRLNCFNECVTHIRLKRHYAPGEEQELRDRRICIPSAQEPYPLFHWRGAYFTVFNCYELANVEDRALFRSKIDFMVTCEWNADTNYFSNIAESSARDLHCYFVQVNTAQYGDSRIVSPTKTEAMNLLRTKGGKNETLLIQDLEIDALRQFQRLAPLGQKRDERFKMTPPNFNHAEIDLRIENRRPNDY